MTQEGRFICDFCDCDQGVPDCMIGARKKDVHICSMCALDSASIVHEDMRKKLAKRKAKGELA